MKIWIDFVNEPADSSYTYCKSFSEAKDFIIRCEKNRVKFKDMPTATELWSIELIDVLDILYLDLLTWFKETNRHYKVVKHP